MVLLVYVSLESFVVYESLPVLLILEAETHVSILVIHGCEKWKGPFVGHPIFISISCVELFPRLDVACCANPYVALDDHEFTVLLGFRHGLINCSSSAGVDKVGVRIYALCRRGLVICIREVSLKAIMVVCDGSTLSATLGSISS